MKFRHWNINAFFLAACALLFAGCKTTEQKKADKEQTLMSLHLETNADGSPRNAPVPVFRSHPVKVNIVLDPFLGNNAIDAASIVDVEGGFAIQLRFSRYGARVLENITVANRGKRIAVRGAFPELRWLAAPLITKRISDGIFIFTPDATREESERIVRGINNLTKKERKDQWLKE